MTQCRSLTLSPAASNSGRCPNKKAAALMSTGMRGASPRCGVVRMSTWDELRCAPRQKLAEFAGTEIFSIDFP